MGNLINAYIVFPPVAGGADALNFMRNEYYDQEAIADSYRLETGGSLYLLEGNTPVEGTLLLSSGDKILLS